MNEKRTATGMKTLLLALITIAAVALLFGLFSGLNVLPFGGDDNRAVNDIPPPPPGPPSTPAPQAAASEPGFTVNQDTVEIRSGPNPGYPAIGVINRGQTFTPNGRTPAGDWLQFPWEGMDGWVYAQSLIVIASDQLPVVQDFPPPPPPSDTSPPGSSPPDSPPPDSPPPNPPGTPPSG